MTIPACFHLDLYGGSFKMEGILQVSSILPVAVIHPDKVVQAIDIDIRTSAVFVIYSFSMKPRYTEFTLTRIYHLEESFLEALKKRLQQADKKNPADIGLIAVEALREISEKRPIDEEIRPILRKSRVSILCRL